MESGQLQFSSVSHGHWPKMGLGAIEKWFIYQGLGAEQKFESHHHGERRHHRSWDDGTELGPGWTGLVRPRPWLWRIDTKWRVEWKSQRKTIGNMGHPHFMAVYSWDNHWSKLFFLSKPRLMTGVVNLWVIASIINDNRLFHELVHPQKFTSLPTQHGPSKCNLHGFFVKMMEDFVK